MTRVHIIGAGLAGLSAALHLAERGRAVTLYEAAPQAGGRCRSFLDDQLDRVIDNGGHVVMGANRAAMDFLRATGGIKAMTGIAPASFPFIDLDSGESWAIRPNAGPLPWWVLSPDRRVPRTHARDYLSALRLLGASADAVVADCIDVQSRLAVALWVPLCVAVMNALPETAAARPLGRMLRETFGRGEAACRPWVAANGLSAAFVDPALARLSSLGVSYRAGWRLIGIERAIGQATALRFDAGHVDLAADDLVALAVPHYAAADLLPGLAVPDGATAIVNAHFRLDRPAVLPGGRPLLGLVNGTAQWLIVHGDIVSVTVSAADALVDRPAAELLPLLWRDVARTLGTADLPMPPARLIKERRATFIASPQNERRRPGPVTAWRNVFLAGDWTDTGIPATIESAIRSGIAVGRAILAAGGRAL